MDWNKDPYQSIPSVFDKKGFLDFRAAIETKLRKETKKK